jgi:hypothetical protein
MVPYPSAAVAGTALSRATAKLKWCALLVPRMFVIMEALTFKQYKRQSGAVHAKVSYSHVCSKIGILTPIFREKDIDKELQQIQERMYWLTTLRKLNGGQFNDWMSRHVLPRIVSDRR